MAMDTKGGFGEIMSMVRGFQVAKMLMVAVDLGVFDFLVEPKSAVQTAVWLKADPRATGIFLNGLVGLGLLDKDGDNFKNGELPSRYLVRGSENYRGAIVKHIEHTWDRGWESLKDTVLAGHPPAVETEKWVDGRPERDEASVRAFIWGMHAIARDLAPKVAAMLDLKAVRRLLDLGGGPATYAITFAQANPALKATVFDLPMPIEIARENIAKNGLTDRVDLLAGNFLKDDIGSGYDFIWISQILHSHDEEQSQFIIAKAVAALDSRRHPGHPRLLPQPRRRQPHGRGHVRGPHAGRHPPGPGLHAYRSGGMDAGGGTGDSGVHRQRHGRQYPGGEKEVVQGEARREQANREMAL